ncbi:MAG TPA: hypothetical protein VFR41_08815, partial [Acidimicrobiia bacterium]|nr:hypothetical protein [Acidimicrobiia bacterium]
MGGAAGNRSRTRARFGASISALALACGSLTAVAVAVVQQVATAPPVGAFTAPDLVTNVSPTSVNPPSSLMFGGRQESISINPANPQIVLSASELGGLWRSNDGGQTWAHVDSLPMTAMRQVMFAASDPSLVIVSGTSDSHVVNQGGMWRSNDGGNSWTHIDTDTPCAAGFGNIYGFDIAQGTPGSLKIYAASQCGLLYSADSGQNWSTVRPTGGNQIFFDVKTKGVSGNTQVYACGRSGFYFSATGSSWTATDPSSPVNITPGGRATGGYCSLAVAPNDANSVFVTTDLKTNSADGCSEQLEESDNANAAVPTWTDLRACPGDTNGRRPFVVTHPNIVSPPDPNKFEVFMGDNTRVHRNTCDITASPHCTTGNGNWPLYDGSEAHNGTDPTDIAFDPTIPNGCPVLESGDGGIYKIKDCTYSPAMDDETTGLNAL